MIPATVTFWPSLTRTSGEVANVNWREVFERFSVWTPFAGDRDHPGWSAARFSPAERALENVRELSAIVLDYDGTCSMDAAAELWAEFYGFMHTTRKHTPEVHRFRVVLPFGRTVSPYEYAEIWRRIFARAGGKLDPAPKDPSRFWFVPGCADREHFEVRYLGGQPMDPDAILAEPEPARGADVIPIHRSDAGQAERRASAYIARMPEAIAGQGGHQALWAVALAAVAGFGLDEGTALALIRSEYNPRCQPPWSEKELRHKVRDAAGARVPMGYKLDESRDFAPRGRLPKYEPVASPEPSASIDPEQAEVPPDACAHYGVRTIAEILAGVYQRAREPRRDRTGAICGHFLIDRVLGTFRRGRVTVLGAATSWGKSSFAVMTTDESLKIGKRVLLVTGEDPEDTYGQRLMAKRAGVNAMQLRDGEVRPGDLARMAAVADEAEQVPFFLNGIGKPAEYLAGAIRAICKQADIDLVIVDYLQAFSCSKRCQDRRNEITHIARTFTDAIKVSNAAGLVFSQLKRMEDGAKPTMHDLKESGDVENMAEHVLIGYAQKSKDHKTPSESLERFVLLEKNKDGPRLLPPIPMPFHPPTASFIPQDAYAAQRHYTDE